MESASRQEHPDLSDGKVTSQSPNDHDDATEHSLGQNYMLPSSLSIPSPDNQLKSLASTKDSCGRTDAETELSSSQSQACGIRDPKHGRLPSDTPVTCMGCILPMSHGVEERHRNDCFVVIDNSTSLLEPGYSDSFPDAAMREVRALQADFLPISNFTAPELFTARLTPRTLHSKEASEAKFGATMASTSNTLHRRSDISHMGMFTAQTLDAIYSFQVIKEEVGTPYDRDSQRDIGNETKGVRPKYHTPEHRERIDSDSFRRTMEVVTCEKRSDVSGDSDVSSIALDAFFSPTLEYPNSEENIVAETTPPVQLPPSSSRKRLVFDSGSVPQYGTPRSIPKCTPNEDIPAERNLFQFSPPMTISKERVSPLSALGISVMSSFKCLIKLLQSIARGSRRCRPTCCRRCRRRHHSQLSNTSTLIDDTEGCWTSGHRKTIPKSLPKLSPLPSASILKKKRHVDPSFRRVGGQWEDTFLPKSSTFLKEIRRSGQKGEVIIQGWIAFRVGNTASWDGIIRNPKRSDFRYIILLEDTLHIFKSRNKKKKKSSPLVLPPPKSDAFLQDCISLNLTAGDIAVRINLVSKKYGNEVCIYIPETEEVQCSLLPIPMSPSIFVDRHKSRLGKGEVLKGVFLDPFKETTTSSSGETSAPSSIISSSTTTEDDVYGTPTASTSTTPAAVSSATTRADDDSSLSLAPTEQYDVSRHVLFAIDAAIRIPIPTTSIVTISSSSATSTNASSRK